MNTKYSEADLGGGPGGLDPPPPFTSNEYNETKNY